MRRRPAAGGLWNTLVLAAKVETLWTLTAMHSFRSQTVCERAAARQTNAWTASKPNIRRTNDSCCTVWKLWQDGAQDGVVTAAQLPSEA